MACLPGTSPQEGLLVGSAPGQQLPSRVLFLAMLQSFWPKVRRALRRGDRSKASELPGILGKQRFRFSSSLGQRFRFQLLFYFSGVRSSLVRCQWNVSSPYHSPANPGQQSREKALKHPAKPAFVRGNLTVQSKCYYNHLRLGDGERVQRGGFTPKSLKPHCDASMTSSILHWDAALCLWHRDVPNGAGTLRCCTASPSPA